MELAHEGGFDLCGLQNRFNCFASQEIIDFLDFSHVITEDVKDFREYEVVNSEMG